jgi:hypothetical protein
MGEMRNVYNILVGKADGKCPLRRSSCRWDDNIRMDLMIIVWEVVDWIHLVQDRDQWGKGCCKHGNEILCSIKGMEFLE